MISAINKKMQKFDTVIIGGGAAGIVAAISARRSGKNVVICEKMQRLGKKILISGAGRCNISNLDLNEAHYNTEGRELVKSIFSRFGREKIENFFNELGLKLGSEVSMIFPATDQAASVLRVLEDELKALKVAVELDFEVNNIAGSPKGFIVKSRNGKSIMCNTVIITGGGKSYPSLGSDGSCYVLASSFGHKITAPIPSAVPLVTKDIFCHLLQGQKIQCVAKAVIGGKVKKETEGELLFTKYGLSGTAILDISEDISIIINRLGAKFAQDSIDMVPFIGADELKEEIIRRINKGFTEENLMIGILPNKFSLVFRDLFKGASVEKIVNVLKDKRFDIIDTKSWNEAEFTSGGVNVKDIKESTLESKLKKSVYFAGEILDVNGERGGYNLAWAWASGFVAGLTE
ncbi:MAG: aminoacetone oxidase family FAD-binding enzyme [Candidatus Omnitrophica bacterium]|nr:aminoacetone oxidase family FAD-binding enzyme [Candidatus Omnitrophota bacterium]